MRDSYGEKWGYGSRPICSLLDYDLAFVSSKNVWLHQTKRAYKHDHESMTFITTHSGEELQSHYGK